MLTLIQEEFDKFEGKINSKKRNKVQRKLYKKLPNNKKELIKLFDNLVKKGDGHVFWLVTIWLKRKKLYNKEYIQYYEKWLYNEIKSWGACDVFCYRVLNPMVEKFPEFYNSKVLKWTESELTYVRRATPVSMLESSRSFNVNFSFEKVKKVVNILKDDQEYYVKKGVGWLLKYTYISYPERTYQYLQENVAELDRIIFRYALEKAPKKEKETLMQL